MDQVHCRVQEPIQILWLSYIVVELTAMSQINYPLDLEILKLYRDFCEISNL